MVVEYCNVYIYHVNVHIYQARRELVAIRYLLCTVKMLSFLYLDHLSEIQIKRRKHYDVDKIIKTVINSYSCTTKNKN